MDQQRRVRPRSAEVSNGSWLCENAAAQRWRRIDVPPSVVSGRRNFTAWFCSNRFRKIILVVFRIFEFLHSLGQSGRFGGLPTTSAIPPMNRPILPPDGMSQRCQQRNSERRSCLAVGEIQSPDWCANRAALRSACFTRSLCAVPQSACGEAHKGFNNVSDGQD
jgi:hypothetical protein